MSKSILIIGESGSGKSTSIEQLNPKETFIIRVTDKDLPFKGWKSKYVPFVYDEVKATSTGNIYTSSNAQSICKILKHISDTRKEIKDIVIDDSQYIMSFEFMAKAKETGFAKFTDIAKSMFDVVSITSKLREDLFVFMLAHSETIQDFEGSSKTQIKTIGKLLNDKITIEGLFTIVLLTNVEVNKDDIIYQFITNTDGKTTAKSPKGMFDKKMPNNLALVKSKIIEYEN